MQAERTRNIGRRKPQKRSLPLDVLLQPICEHTRLQLQSFAPRTRAQLQVALAGRLLAKASAVLIEGSDPETVARLVALGAEVDALLPTLAPDPAEEPDADGDNADPGQR